VHHTVQAYQGLSHMNIMSIILGQMVVWVLSNGRTLFSRPFLMHVRNEVSVITCLHESGVLGLTGTHSKEVMCL
jgi:hypothetical protein